MMGCSGHNYDDIVATDNVKHLCILEGMFLKLEIDIHTHIHILWIHHLFNNGLNMKLVKQ
jgi:hypothetical protein